MYKQLSINELLYAIKTHIESKTEIKCYTDLPVNKKSPLYFAEWIGSQPVKSKTMFRTEYEVYMHVIDQARENRSTAGLYNMIRNLEEIMTKDISIPDQYNLIMQTNGGLVSKQLDETNEWHAIISYRFDVCYGFKIK